MFRIRRIFDFELPIDKEALPQIENILRTQFFELPEKEIKKIPGLLKHPERYEFYPVLFVADNLQGKVEGLALLLHFSDLDFCLLDYLATEKRLTSHGVGSALYERVREEVLSFGGIGLFYECLPDSPKFYPDLNILKQNKTRLRFYESFGARPIISTLSETPYEPGCENPPFMVFDSLGKDVTLRRDQVRKMVKAVLERKYPGECTPEYSRAVIDSYIDDPAKLRRPICTKEAGPVKVDASISFDKRIVLIVNDRHVLHHVNEKGYAESPVRIKTILKELEKTNLFERLPVRQFGERYITAVHNRQFVEYLRKVTSSLKPNQVVYPHVFPLRNEAQPPRDLPDRAGFYCTDTFTPLTRNAFIAAKRAVGCSLTAASYILSGHRLTYALVRPPGHHAERRTFGGFSYFNSAAISAHYLSSHGNVAMLDLDHHHGNGQQEIFYERKDVLTISIHVHPKFNYPYFCGFKKERGKKSGKGYNLNVPLPEHVDGRHYIKILEKIIKIIRNYNPKFLVIPLGLDTSKRDPTGTWSLLSRDYEEIGKMLGGLKLPTLVIQEGGYNNRVLGVNARCFFEGLWSGTFLGKK